MWSYNYDELYHFGIKGQKWGVRRFQDKDGSLTNAGKKRYNDNDGAPKEKKKSKHRQKLEDAYIANGFSKEEAAKRANARIKTEKIVAATAAVTVAACALYLSKDRIKDKMGGYIKTKDDLQRIETDDSGKLHDVFYMSKGKHDNTRYKNMFGFQKSVGNGSSDSYVMKLKANEKIKIASNDKAAKVFGDMYKNDTDFRNRVNENTFISSYRKNNFGKKNLKDLYNEFNTGMVDTYSNDNVKESYGKFFNKLKSSGYGAVRDINDSKFSGFNTRNPLIVFNNKGGKSISVKDISKFNIDGSGAKFNKELYKAHSEIIADQALKSLGGFTIATSTVGSFKYITSKPNDKPKPNKKRK